MAPLPVKVAELPAQIAVGEEDAPTDRAGVTVKESVLVLVQPDTDVPVTV